MSLLWFTEHSTSQSAADTERVSHIASAGPPSPTDDSYTKFKLSFAIDTIQMELFTGDRDVVNLFVVILLPFTR